MSAEISGEIGFGAPAGGYGRMGQDFLRNFLVGDVARQKPFLVLWLPVVFAAGVGVYFALPIEPPFAVAVFGMIAVLAGVALAPLRYRALMFVLAMAAAGFAAAQIHTELVRTPFLEKEIKWAGVEGRIETIEDLEDGKGSRVVLADVKIEEVAPATTPVKVRISVKKDEGLQAGQVIRMQASLSPPSPPLTPGGFDFQRYMYFARIGALGYTVQQPEVIGPAPAGRDMIEKTRVAIDRKIAAALPYPEAAVAMALVTGRRAGISDAANDAITAAGLAHILSISGLHISLVSGIIFFVTRFLMVCIPGFGLRHPVKKYAAALAFMGAVFYTLLAGSTVPTQRSLIMVGIALLAIVADRSPISIRLVAVAALMVLVLAPDALVGASFQMSFAAVAGLVIVFEWLRPWMTKMYSGAGMARKAGLYFMGLALTTIVATLATAPFTVIHFQQLSVYGLIGNGLAVPLSGIVIMPAAVLSVFLMPFGLEYWPLQAMGAGVSGMLAISESVAALPYALVKIAAPPPEILPLFAGGIIWLLLWQGRLRALGVVPLVVAVVMAVTYKLPDIVVAPGFDLAAVRGEDGGLYVSTLRREKFIREKWESLYGLAEGEAKEWPREGMLSGMICDEVGCRVEKNGRRVSILKQPGGAGIECAWAELVLAFDPVRDGVCNVPVIDKFDALDDGAWAVWMTVDGIRTENAQHARGRRPWSGENF